MHETLQIHELANIFPKMPPSEFQSLKADIQANGQLETIVLYDGKVLDGRHRYTACKEIGIETKTRIYEGSDPVGYVISLNLKRRHMNESQRSMVAASLANMQRGGDRPSQNDSNFEHANLHNRNVSQPQAAELLQVSPRSVATAAKVERTAPQEVIEAVKSGGMSLNLAAQVSELEKEDQDIVAAAPIEQMKEVAREAVRAHVANNSGNNEWYTPAEFIEAARSVMGGIDTDPASSEIANRTVKAKKYYTKDDDGLAQVWNGNVWMNPPYAQPLMGDFAEAIASRFEAGEIKQACVLVNNATETKWFQRMTGVAHAICFPSSRIRFIDPEGKPSGAPLQGQAVIYIGDDEELFMSEFSKFGFVVVVP